MGKPSSTPTSKKSSAHSLNTTMSKEKNKNKNRTRRHLKTQQSINKLFEKLRDQSQHSLQNVSQCSSQICIDLDDSITTMIPDELRIKLPTPLMDSIIIDDGEQKACSTPKNIPLHTPYESKIDDIILAQSSNLNITKKINRDSYLTIDLTAESGINSSVIEPTVIDLANTTEEVTLADVSSMSGESEVTVLQQPVRNNLRKYARGIANLNASDKGKLLDLITKTIFNGCSVSDMQHSLPNEQKSLPRAPETAEDTYIKEVILGSKPSRSSIGSNVYNPDRHRGVKSGPRMIVIDGSNVAMQHERGKIFSVRGLQICIDYFLRRGHDVKAFVPRFRCKHRMSSDPRLLDYLERKGLVIYTPSREVKGRTITPYDDRYIIQCAAEFDAVVVSGDNYRDLVNENPRWRSVIENRLLPFTWVGDMIMFPKDPLGRYGPTLEEFLRHPKVDNAGVIDIA